MTIKKMKLIYWVVLCLLILVSCGGTTASSGDDDTPPLLGYATAITDTAYGNGNHVQRNYYFLVDVTADSTDKLKLVVKESSKPAPTAAEIKAGAGQTKTLGTTAKTVMFSYPIDSKIGNYQGAPIAHYPHTASSNIDGLFLKPGTAYTIYATSPDDTGAVLTGGSYTPPAFDARKVMLDLTQNVAGVTFGTYDASLFSSTLSIHADDPLFVLPIVAARLSRDTGENIHMNLLKDNVVQSDVGFDLPGYDDNHPARFFFPSLYYDTSRTVPHQFDAGTLTGLTQTASFSFYFNDPSAVIGKWGVSYKRQNLAHVIYTRMVTVNLEE